MHQVFGQLGGARGKEQCALRGRGGAGLEPRGCRAGARPRQGLCGSRRLPRAGNNERTDTEHGRVRSAPLQPTPPRPPRCPRRGGTGYWGCRTINNSRACPALPRNQRRSAPPPEPRLCCVSGAGPCPLQNSGTGASSSALRDTGLPRLEMPSRTAPASLYMLARSSLVWHTIIELLGLEGASGDHPGRVT